MNKDICLEIALLLLGQDASSLDDYGKIISSLIDKLNWSTPEECPPFYGSLKVTKRGEGYERRIDLGSTPTELATKTFLTIERLIDIIRHRSTLPERTL